MDFLFTPEAISSLLTLTFLEVILGIDNIVFISIVVGKLPVEKRKGATNIGLLLALVLRILLLFAISWLVAMQSTLFEISTSSVHAAINGQSLILFLGGLFLLYKSTKEIHEKIDHVFPPPRAGGPPLPSKKATLIPCFREIAVRSSLALKILQLAIK